MDELQCTVRYSSVQNRIRLRLRSRLRPSCGYLKCRSVMVFDKWIHITKLYSPTVVEIQNTTILNISVV